MSDFTEHIGVLYLDLHIPEAQSLKEKRMVLKSLKDRIRAKFNVSIAELDGQDTWQRVTCGVVMIGTDRRYINTCLDNIVSYTDAFSRLYLTKHEISFF